MKIVHYDTDTQKVLGWYDKNIHKNIPIPNIEVSDEDWKTALNENANYVDVKNKTLSFKDFRTSEEIKTQLIFKWKKDRQIKVDNIEVTYNNVVYQGDETSQTRITKAITALPDDDTTIDWIAKDNSVQSLTRVDLKAILLYAGTQQSKIWNEGRPE